MYHDIGRPCLHQEYELIFSSLDAADIRYCLLRPYDGLQTIEKDLDILIDPVKKAEAFAVLEAWSNHLLRTAALLPGKAVMCKWTGEALVGLDIHFKLIAKGYEYMSAERALSRRVLLNRTYQLSPLDMDILARQFGRLVATVRI